MSNTNNNLQTQTSNALHNAIMEAGGKDHPPMLAPVAEGSSETTTEGYMENYNKISQDIRDQVNAEAEAIQIILTGINNEIYSTVDACPNACEMWKAIERLRQVLTSITTKMAKAKDATYHKEKMILCKLEEAKIQLSAEQADWRDDTGDEPDNQELEAHYMYMVQMSEHPEQPESVNDTYLVEQDEHNIIIDSLDMCYNREQVTMMIMMILLKNVIFLLL
ncbi:hypothetical protein Tco_0041183 [Tanacetum coccineum]